MFTTKANATASVLFILLAAIFVVGPGCQEEKHPQAAPPVNKEMGKNSQESPKKESQSQIDVDTIPKPGGANAGVIPNVNAPLQERNGEKCRPMFHQTGQGCDMEGIVAQILPERKGNGGIPRCYLTHVVPPREGKMRLAFGLTPEGEAMGFRWMLDDFKNEDLKTCLVQVFKGLHYPAPGDVPCQVVYPLTFVPEVKY